MKKFWITNSLESEFELSHLMGACNDFKNNGYTKGGKQYAFMTQSRDQLISVMLNQNQ